MLNAVALPAVLTTCRQWVGWRKELRGSKPTKVPINPHTGRRGKVNRPETWGSYDDACAAINRYSLDGVGFVFTRTDSFVGIDVDKCRSAETGDIEPWVRDLVSTLNSYTEVSQSGTGVHVLVEGTLPPGSRRKGRVEMYDRDRFFIMTGQHLLGTPREIHARDSELQVVHAQYLGAAQNDSTNDTDEQHPQQLSDGALIQQASSARNGGKFTRLWNGTWRDEYDSQSEADAALCALFAFWTDKDAVRIDTMFRQSGLFRPKWDEPHYSGGRTYGQETISGAIALTRDGYHGAQMANGSERQTQDERPWLNAGEQDLKVITKQAWRAIERANHPPRLFQWGGVPSRLHRGPTGIPVLKILDVDVLRHEAARAARWYIVDNGKHLPAKPPVDVIRDMLASPAQHLPHLDRIVEIPVFGHDGRLLETPGYHASDAVYYAPAENLTIPPVASQPTQGELQ